jgi:DNA helicase-2/ATP-dependent DNA helicase PcrA
VNAELKPDSRIRRDPAQLEAALPDLTITYSDTGSNFIEGRIFHDDLIRVARAMFEESPLLSRLVAARFPCIFVDEYQDASPLVIEILTERILAGSPGRVVIGLFGDKLQHIYDSGVGELPLESLNRLERIVKSENYRCSKAVISLLNRLRTDIHQVPGDRNLDGQAIYVSVGTADSAALTRVRAMTAERFGWRHDEGLQRELYLTHRLIARNAGYHDLLDAYDRRGGLSRDRLLSGEDSRIDFFLRYVEPLRIAWAGRDSGAAVSVLRDAGLTLSTTQTKAATASALDRLAALCGGATVGDVLRHLEESNLLLGKFPDGLRERLAGTTPAVDDTPEAKEREERNAAFYAAFFALPYPRISAFALFLTEHTAYATKHGVKGAEFDTVFVVLDDQGARWNIYSFEKYLTGEDPETS